MSDTLAALHAAVIDAPADRTVRLVYADALDESGAPADAARAEFIRAQIALEGMTDDDPQRAALAGRCQDLFATHWIAWWRPVCTALGLREPYVPGRGLGSRVKRFVGRDKHATGAPYFAHPQACSLDARNAGNHANMQAFAAQFIGGFPEMLYFGAFAPPSGAELLSRWMSAMPIARLRFGNTFDWPAVDGPHLAKVRELAFDRLPAETAELVARATHLGGLESLKVQLSEPEPLAGALRALICRPVWARLRSFTLRGISHPATLDFLAHSCTLEHLEELSFTVGEVPAPPPLADTVPALVADALLRTFTDNRHPRGPIRWEDYVAVFFALARSPVVRRLRRLRVFDADPVTSELAEINRSLTGDQAPLSDECVLALADAMSRDKLERLELPATLLSVVCREELSRRFGSRFVPA